FEWLSLVPVLAFLGLLHSVGLAVVAAVWPRAARRPTVVLGAVLMLPLLVLAGRPLALLTLYAIPLALALAVYALASRIPGSRTLPEELHGASLREDELLGPPGSPWVVPRLQQRPPPKAAGPSRQAR